MIITIAGKPGSGKSTVGKLVAKKLKYKFYSVGNIRGEIAMEKGMTIDELNKLGEKEDWTDREVDAKTEKMGNEKDNFVIDSRLGWHFIPHSVKIYLDVDPRIGADRILSAKRKDEKQYKEVEEVMNAVEERVKSDDKRYKKYYSIDIHNMSNYDLIIDTSALTQEEIADKIIVFAKDFE